MEYVLLEPNAEVIEQNQNLCFIQRLQTRIHSETLSQKIKQTNKNLSRYGLEMPGWLRVGIVFAEFWNLNLNHCA